MKFAVVALVLWLASACSHPNTAPTMPPGRECILALTPHEDDAVRLQAALDFTRREFVRMPDHPPPPPLRSFLFESGAERKVAFEFASDCGAAREILQRRFSEVAQAAPDQRVGAEILRLNTTW